MNYTVITYLLYIVITIALTIWVGRTLYKNGRVFLIDCFDKRADVADSVNHLLVVGFYLLNFGFVMLFLNLEERVDGLEALFEALSKKLGIVLLVLGAMHIFNIVVFNKFRERDLGAQKQPTPPTPPAGYGLPRDLIATPPKPATPPAGEKG